MSDKNDGWKEYTIRIKEDPSWPHHGTDIEFNGMRYVRADLPIQPPFITEINSYQHGAIVTTRDQTGRTVHEVTVPYQHDYNTQAIIKKLLDGWFLVPPEPTDDMIQAYMFERAKMQYPHEDAGGGVIRKIIALFTGKRSDAHRTYHQMIDASMRRSKDA